MPKLLIACALVAGAAAGLGDSANWVTVNGQSTTPVANCGGSKQYVRRMQYVGSGSDGAGTPHKYDNGEPLAQALYNFGGGSESSRNACYTA